jgi:hypothetical protein
MKTNGKNGDVRIGFYACHCGCTIAGNATVTDACPWIWGGRVGAAVPVSPKSNSPKLQQLGAMLRNSRLVWLLLPALPDSATAFRDGQPGRRCEGRNKRHAAARCTQAAALKTRWRTASISAGEKSGCRLRCMMRSSSNEASSVSNVWPEADRSVLFERIWWISQPPQPIASSTTASCVARISVEGEPAATNPSSSSRHKSTRSIHDTTCATPGAFGDCTRPASRPARRPVTRLSNNSAVSTLMHRLCQQFRRIASAATREHP